jgi:hypothetical protein
MSACVHRGFRYPVSASGRRSRRDGTSRRASASCPGRSRSGRGELSRLWWCLPAGAQPLPAAHLRSGGGRSPHGQPSEAAAVLLRRRRMPEDDVRRAGHRTDRAPRAAQRTDPPGADQDRVGRGRASRTTANRTPGTVHGPDDATAADPDPARARGGDAEGVGRRRLRAATWPHLRHHVDRHGDPRSRGRASRPHRGHPGRLATRAPRSRDHLPRPSRRVP